MSGKEFGNSEFTNNNVHTLASLVFIHKKKISSIPIAKRVCLDLQLCDTLCGKNWINIYSSENRWKNKVRILPMSNTVNQWVLIWLSTGVLVRGYLKEQKWLKDSYIIKGLSQCGWQFMVATWKGHSKLLMEIVGQYTPGFNNIEFGTTIPGYEVLKDWLYINQNSFVTPFSSPFHEYHGLLIPHIWLFYWRNNYS